MGRAAAEGDGAQREVDSIWRAAVAASGLPMAMNGDRARLTFAAPLPVGMTAAGELIDLVLTDRWPRWRVREAIEPVIPAGWTLHALDDVWLGAPSLPASVVAADYLVTLAVQGAAAGAVEGAVQDAVHWPASDVVVDPPAPDVADGAADSPAPDWTEANLANAVQVVNALTTLPRERVKGGATVTYDLRPLFVGGALVGAGPIVRLRLRTVIHPTLGNGRPEEVLAAISDALGRPLAIAEISRERLVLAGDIQASGR